MSAAIPDIEYIEIKGVRTHNLKNIAVKVPLGKWTAVTGVSGSGKSSLVFNTIYAESQRRFLETLGTYERQFLQGLPMGEFDSINQIPASVALKQTNRSTDPRSTLGNMCDLIEPMRNLFASLLEPSCTKCGNLVTHHSVGDVKLTLQENKTNSSQWLLGIPITIPATDKAYKEITQSYMIEGFDRGFTDEIFEFSKVPSLASWKAFTKQSETKSFLLLDRLSNQIAEEELNNRLETVWSQLKFSENHWQLSLFPFNGKNVSMEGSKSFFVQPFCSSCQETTHIIRTSDFDFQSVLGACDICHGMGNIAVPNRDKILPDLKKSVANGAIKIWGGSGFDWAQTALENLVKSVDKKNLTKPFEDLDPYLVEYIFSGKDPAEKFLKQKSFVPIFSFMDQLYKERYKPSSRIVFSKYSKFVVCPECHGARLKKAGLVAKCNGYAFNELCTQELVKTREWVETLATIEKMKSKLLALKELREEILVKLNYLCRLGLATHSLWRKTRTMSGGEFQRVLLARMLGNGLTDALYVLDEPSVGLGNSEIHELISCLRELREKGNTILMVEHESQLVSAADFWLELGPGGGNQGGRVLKSEQGGPQCSVVDLEPLSTLINRKSVKPLPLKSTAKNAVFLKDFNYLNCKNISVEIFLGTITLITGPSGSGKSNLVRAGLSSAFSYAEDNIHGKMFPDSDGQVASWEMLQLPKDFFENCELVTLSQTAGTRKISSVPCTILGIFDEIRKLFAKTVEAKEQGLTASDFSFNGIGGCLECSGNGVTKEDLFFLGESEKVCMSCNGSRYRSEVLWAKWNSKSISEILNLTISESAEVFKHHSSIVGALKIAQLLGIGHLPLGGSSSNFSGGEHQRLRIASLLAQRKKKIFCILDEPSRGLSDKDVLHLCHALYSLAKDGHTFVLAEHHFLFEYFAHQIIALGPKSGLEGGRVVARELALSLNSD